MTVLLISAAAMVHAADEKPKWHRVMPDTPASLAEHDRIVCAKFGEREVTMDIYVPKEGDTFPALLLIHGGGWAKGQVEQDKPLAERLAVQGFVVAQIDYRLSGETKYPAALYDCKAAVRFLRAHAAEYKIDPTRIGCIGGSAGGHLSGLLAMSNGQTKLEGDGGNAEQSSAVQACIVMAATMDLVEANMEKTSENAVTFFGSTCADNPAIYKEASPITYVNDKSVPTMFIEGEKDTVKIGRSRMQDELRALHIDTPLLTLKDAPHPFWMSQPWLDETAKAAGEFFAKHLKK
ncbi:MAG: alpha/beta hydrolase fold domain-containing protein [Planctomycetes bacterium]|nr:alpha/beta hydrolase fold domain-containing protein [Planctomycetota bacterium]